MIKKINAIEEKQNKLIKNILCSSYNIVKNTILKNLIEKKTINLQKQKLLQIRRKRELQRDQLVCEPLAQRLHKPLHQEYFQRREQSNPQEIGS